MKRIITLTVVALMLGTASAFAGQDLPQKHESGIATVVPKLLPLPLPHLPAAADAMWQKWVLGCFDQANKRRERYGTDTAPIFVAVRYRGWFQIQAGFADKSIELPATNAASRCHVPSASEIEAGGFLLK